MFLVDMWCTGVREAFYRLRIEPEELDELMFRDHDLIDFREISYEEAHNRIYGAIAFAEEAGLKPDKSFQTAQYLLEEDTDDVPLMEFEFGKDGEYFLVCESQLEASRYLPTLRRTLGEDGFKYIVGLYDDDDDDDDDDGDDDGRVLISDNPVTVADLVGCMDISGQHAVCRPRGCRLPEGRKAPDSRLHEERETGSQAALCGGDGHRRSGQPVRNGDTPAGG